MAGKNEDEKIPNVPDVLDDVERAGNNEQEKSGDQASFDAAIIQITAIQNATWEFVVNHCSQEEISIEANWPEKFCLCVTSIIKAYQGKLEEVEGLNRVIKVLKTKNQGQNQEIRKLQHTITELRNQLASACEECKGKLPEKLRSLSLKETESSPTPGETEVDGRAGESTDTNQKTPLENEETGANEKQMGGSKFSYLSSIRCPQASCGLVALLCLFNKKNIHFCPTQFIQKVALTTRHLDQSCTKILNHLLNLGFLKRPYKCERIDEVEGGHNEVLKIAAKELIKSGQEVGLLSYSTEEYNHCVTVYITDPKEATMKVIDDDEHLNMENIKDLDQVRSLEIIVLKCYKDGIPSIKKNWGSQCHINNCIYAFTQLSQPENNEISNLSLDLTNARV